MENQTVNEGKTTAIISYITWIGTLIAFIMNNGKKNSFASFHIRQMIGLSLFSLANSFIIGRFAGYWVTGAIGMALFVLWIIGFIGAIQGEEKRVPLIGDLFQDWFKGIA
ncbi:hypothetical protein [Lutibacter sp.]|uniref:DUF4870 domain-containing protein n=1 Tax=Lutibacter sp. TaxID=1925666 RepID=UPI0025BEDB6A|nr:hypothetical protein [Lutibacter sp.]MCF6167860.1 hypothetical protein [Lutibacter sp.]